MSSDQIKLIKKAIQICEGQEKMASDLGLRSQGSISQWVTGRRPLPPKHCIKIEQLTDGEVTRYQLRPDIFGTAPSQSDAA